MEAEFISMVSTVGFPIAITIYLLVTRDKTISQNTEAINQNTQTLKILCEKIEK